jgi:hypothetical protein
VEVGPIQFGALSSTILPLWITDPTSGARLVGDKAVETITIAVSLVVVGVPLGAFWYFAFSTSDVGLSLQNPIALFLGLLVLTSITWLVTIFPGMFVALRYGSYDLGKGSGAAPKLTRRYFQAVGVLSLAVLAILVMYSNISPTGFGTLAIVAFALALLFYSNYAAALKGRWSTVTAATLLGWSATVVLFTTVFAAHAVVSFPKEDDFEETLVYVYGPESSPDAWERAGSLLDATNAIDRNELLDFLSTVPVSVPSENTFVVSEIPDFALLTQVVPHELSAVDTAMEQEDWDKASRQYLRLWRAVDKLLTGNVILVQNLVGITIATQLIDFYMTSLHQDELTAGNDVRRIAASVRDRLDDAFVSGIAGEYVAARYVYVNAPDALCDLGASDTLRFCLPFAPWPFFDKTQTMKTHHDLLAELAEVSRQPFHASKSGRDAYRVDYARITTPSRFDNPIGSQLLRGIVPDVGGFVYSKEKLKSRFAILLFVMDARAARQFPTVPIDRLTGRPYQVQDKGRIVEIVSSYIEDDGQVALRYEVPDPTELIEIE